MKLKVYQITDEGDDHNLKFCNYDFTENYGGINPKNYACVFNGYMDAMGLEDVYVQLNTDRIPGTYRGHSLSVSDIVVIEGDIQSCSSQYGCSETGSFFCDSYGFRKIDFDESLATPLTGLRCVEIQPNKPAFESIIGNDLQSLQNAVSKHQESSMIEFTYPFDDNAMIMGNENAKLISMQGNRRICHEVYAGPLFIVGDDGHASLCDLTDEQVRKYCEMFAEPEQISQEEVEDSMRFRIISFDF